MSWTEVAGHTDQGILFDHIAPQLRMAVPSVSVLAAMDGGGFEYDGIANQVLAALIGSTLLAIFPSILSKLNPRRALRPEHASMSGVASE